MDRKAELPMPAVTFIAYLAAAGAAGTWFGFRLGKTDANLDHAIDQALQLAAADDE